MSISECLKDYEAKHGKLIKKNLQSQANTELQGKNFLKKLPLNYTTGKEKSKEVF